MQIKLKRLTLTNFKGIKDKTIDFEDKTDISGANATGKTTIFDAFTWLLFDKDSLDRKNFGIKTFLEDGDTMHKVEHTVEGIFEIDGEELRLKKVYLEDWKKKRGSAKDTFSGHTTKRWIQDVDHKEKDYQKKIESIIPEDRFKLLTNPLYFNEILDYRKRREILLSMVDEVTPDDVYDANPELEELKQYKLPIEEIQTLKKSRATLINKQLQELPIRIDELVKSKVEYDFLALKKEKSELEADLKTINEKLEDLTSGYSDDSKLKSRIAALESQKMTMEVKHQQEFQEVKKKHADNLLELTRATGESERELLKYESSEDFYRKELEKLRAQYQEIAEKKYEGGDTCPHCHQFLPPEQVEEAVASFQLKRSVDLERCAAAGKEASKYHKESEAALAIARQKHEEATRALESAKEIDPVEPSLPEAYYDTLEEIKSIQGQIGTPPEGLDTLSTVKDATESDLEKVKANLLYQEQNKRTDEKIAEYKEQSKKLAKEYEEAQYLLNLCDEYTKTHVELVTEKLNQHFEVLRFKLFDQQINGGISDTCEALINGTPYSDANRAARINAGIEVINALSKKYDTTAPIFVDNAEAVNKIHDTDSQLIRLIVTEDKELKIA